MCGIYETVGKVMPNEAEVILWTELVTGKDCYL